MIHLLALTALFVSVSSLEPGRSRQDASRELQEALSSGQVEASLPEMISSARAAIEVLGTDAFAETLEQLIVDARWRALTDAGAAKDRLEQELRTALDDLALRPLLDAEPAWFVSIQRRGSLTRANLAFVRARLIKRLQNLADFEIAGTFRLLDYNRPVVTNRERSFEIQTPVQEPMKSDAYEVVLDFGEANAARLWSPVNDSVMGGLSRSQFATTSAGSCVFEGSVSMENNGGFASVRTRPTELDLRGSTALRLNFRGDGKSYKLRLRASGTFDGVNYETVFRTEDGVWQERVFAFDDFVPVWRGRRVLDAPQITAESVTGVGLMISEKQAGPFRLEISTLSKM